MQYIGVHGATYDQVNGGFDFQVTKPDGKVFYVPTKDIQNIARFLRLQEEMKGIEKEIRGLNSNKPKHYDN